MAAKRKSKRLVILGVIAVVLIGLGLWAFVFTKHEETITVTTEKAAYRTITQTVTATGKVQPVIKVDISPEVSGEIVELPVVDGQRVKKGQLLFRIKPDVYIAARDQAAAGVSAAKAGLATSKANEIKAAQDYKRVQGLHEKKLVSDQDFDAAKAAVDAAKANSEAAAHNIEQAAATLKQTEETLRKTSVYAPMDGTITALNSQLGERVLGTQQFNGTLVMTVSDLSAMEVRIDVDENDVVLVHLGDTARIAVDAYPDRKFTGVVTQIANSAATTAAGTQEEVTNFQVRIRVADPDKSFRPGMSATATIETVTKEHVLTVPLQAVTSRLAKKEEESEDEVVADRRKRDTTGGHERPPTVVFLVNGNRAKMQSVRTGISSNTYAEIVEGLKEGDEVVSGNFRAISKDLDDGKKILVDNGRAGQKSGQKEGK